MKIEEKIEFFRMNHRGICIFGREEYNCLNINYENMGYCVFGGCQECEHYLEQLEKLKENIRNQ